MRSHGVALDLLRTLVTGGITTAVGAVLWSSGKRNARLEPRDWPAAGDAPYVEIIVPARNEACNIGPLLESLTVQCYPQGSWGITVVDDGSTDGTGDIARRMAACAPDVRVQVIEAPGLPHGWTGKNHAMRTGYLSSPPQTEWLLFVDADTRCDRHALPSIVLAARETHAALLSLVLSVGMQSFWARVLLPQTGELYTLLVGTMDQVNRGRGTAAANGQCMLVSRAAYGAFGSLPEVRGDVAEDRALAAALKARGHSVRLEHGERLGTLIPDETFSGLWNSFSKTVFWATGRNWARSLAVVAALSFYGLGPWLLLLRGLLSVDRRETRRALFHSAAQLVPMMALRKAVCAQVGVPARYALAYPLGVLVGNAMVLTSMLRVLSGKGVSWKGRLYR